MNEYIETEKYGKVPIKKYFIAIFDDLIDTIEINSFDSNEQFADIRRDAESGELFAILLDKDLKEVRK